MAEKEQKWLKRIGMFILLSIAGHIVEIGFDKAMGAAFTHPLRYWLAYLPGLSNGYVRLGIWVVIFFGGMSLRDKLRERKQSREPAPAAEGWFALELPAQLHNYTPLEAFIRNCGPRTVRSIRFDPIESPQGLNICFDRIVSLTPKERVRLGFHKWNDEIGYAGNVVNFFEGGSHASDQPPYALTIRFLDGVTERAEKHIIEGRPLPKGGVSLKTFPKSLQSESVKERATKLAHELFTFEKQQGPEPPSPLSVKGEEEQRLAFNAYFGWKKDTYFKYMARYRDHIVKTDYELAAEGVFTKLEPKEIDPPQMIGEVNVKKIAEALLLTASQMPD